MNSGTAFSGTNYDQDLRFKNKNEKYKEDLNFPRIFKKKVNLKKLNLDLFRTWINKKILEYFDGEEDEILLNYIFSQLEQQQIVSLPFNFKNLKFY